MKRLIKSNNIEYKIGDNVQWKRHPYDNSVYTIINILPNGCFFMDNGINAFTNIKPSAVKPAN